jgi:hypothetical protein
MNTRVPRGNITTVLDYVDRDIQDDTFFPYTSETSWFAPDGKPRSIPFTPALQTFTYKGPAAFGQKIVVDLDNRAGDLLHNIFIQVELDGPVPDSIIQTASFQVGEVILEEIDSTFTTIALTSFPDANMAHGLSQIIRPTDTNKVTCILPFWFSRTPYKQSFPLVACDDGTVQLNITFSSPGCSGTPPPSFRNINILTYTSLLTGEMRDHIQQTAFEHIFRPVQNFIVENAAKYAILSGTHVVNIPLPFNGPVEEIFWVIRKKDGPFTAAVNHAQLMVNGQPLVSSNGNWFRTHIAGRHLGGINIYRAKIYGYSFAQQPGTHGPTGAINLSRANSVNLRLTLDSDNWQVFVYAIGPNWIRFENGMCGRIFST